MRLSKEDRERILSAKTIAVYSTSFYSGVEIKTIIEGVEFVEICGDNRYPHCSKIFYSRSNRPYFRLNNGRVYLDECMRVDK